MKLEKFMFCMTLETIGLVFGYLGVIIGSGLLLLFVTYVLLPSTIYHLRVIVKDPYGDCITIIFIVIFVSAFIYIHVLLIKGIKNKQHKKIKPWLIFHGSCITFSVYVLVIFLNVGLAPIAMSYIPVLAFHIYCYMAVSSLFGNIRDTSEPGHQFKANVINAGFTMLPTHIKAEEKQSQMDIKLV